MIIHEKNPSISSVGTKRYSLLGGGMVEKASKFKKSQSGKVGSLLSRIPVPEAENLSHFTHVYICICVCVFYIKHFVYYVNFTQDMDLQ